MPSAPKELILPDLKCIEMPKRTLEEQAIVKLIKFNVVLVDYIVHSLALVQKTYDMVANFFSKLKTRTGQLGDLSFELCFGS